MLFMNGDRDKQNTFYEWGPRQAKYFFMNGDRDKQNDFYEWGPRQAKCFL